VRAFRDTRSPEAAFRTAFGTDIPAMERTLQSYIRRFGFSNLSLALPAHDGSTAPAESMREADVHAVLGDLLLGQGAFEEADREFSIALRLDRSHIDARVGAARLSAYKDREAEEIASLRAAVRDAPDSFNASFHLGVALASARQYEARHRRRTTAPSPASPTRLVRSSARVWPRSPLVATSGRRTRLLRARRVDLNAIWLRARAFAAFNVGRDDVVRRDARAFLDQVGWGKEGAPYVGFASAIASWRLGQPDAARAMLDEAARELPDKTWTANVLQFLRGQIDAKTILSRRKTMVSGPRPTAMWDFGRHSTAGSKRRSCTCDGLRRTARAITLSTRWPDVRFARLTQVPGGATVVRTDAPDKHPARHLAVVVAVLAAIAAIAARPRLSANRPRRLPLRRVTAIGSSTSIRTTRGPTRRVSCSWTAFSTRARASTVDPQSAK
jgi:tetratricopeptide (TPR) repeat protein